LVEHHVADDEHTGFGGGVQNLPCAWSGQGCAIHSPSFNRICPGKETKILGWKPYAKSKTGFL
jgi:hypothetical protein